VWQKDRSADEAAGRLENLKELVRSMEESRTMQGFPNTSSGDGTATGDAEDDAVCHC